MDSWLSRLREPDEHEGYSPVFCVSHVTVEGHSLVFITIKAIISALHVIVCRAVSEQLAKS
jgi:hypothetical protein